MKRFISVLVTIKIIAVVVIMLFLCQFIISDYGQAAGTYSEEAFSYLNDSVAENAKSDSQSINSENEIVSVFLSADSDPDQKTFATADAAAADWADKYRPLCKNSEMGSIIYEATGKNGKRYAYGNTYTGFMSNTIPGFLVSYLNANLINLFDQNIRIAGFIHTHTDPGQGYHNDFPSDADLSLLDLPGINGISINEVYIVPWVTCDGIPDIIKATDEQSWSH